MSSFRFGSVAVRTLLGAAFGFVLVPSALRAQATGTALVRHAPTLNGTVDGSVQQMLGEGVRLNGGAIVTGALLVPGTPRVRVNGHPAFGGTADGVGASTPSNYQVTLNGNAALGYLVRHVEPLALPELTAPPLPTGARNVVIGTAGQSVGDWSTLRDLTLNGDVGNYAIPPGTYGNLTVNGGGSITLGVPGALQPAAYNLQHVTLNGQAQVRVVGPVIVTVASSVTVTGPFGTSAQPSWLVLNIFSGGLTLNGGGSFSGYVCAPTGTVIINGNGQLIGGVKADRLSLNGGALLRLFQFVPPNQPPVAHPQEFSTDEDTTLALTLAGSDPEGAPLSFAIDAPPQHGSLSPDSSSRTPGAFTYTPDAHYFGPDSFTFVVSDGAFTSAPATISLNVVHVEHVPVALPPSVETTEDTAVEIVIAASDLDREPLSFAITTPPQHGTLAPVSEMPSAETDTRWSLTFLYTPEPEFHGNDRFAFTGSDGRNVSPAAIVPVTITPVPDVPVATDASLAGSRNQPLNLTLVATDADDDPLIYTIATGPAHGKLGNADGPLTTFPAANLSTPNLTYTPDFNFVASDTFTFTASDPGGLTSAAATINIAVADTNRPPVAQHVAVLELDEDTTVGVALAATDPDGDPVTYAVVQPSHGSLTGTAPDLVYQPYEDFFGDDSFSYHANDAREDSNEVTVAVHVRPVPDAPQTADVAVNTFANTAVEFAVGATDGDGDPLTLTMSTAPAHGVLSPTFPLSLTPSTPAVSVTYTPSANYAGPDEVSFTLGDGTTAPVTCTVTVIVANRAPTATNQAVTIVEDTPTAIVLAGTDPDGQPLAYTVVDQPQHGHLEGTAPNLTYVPDENFDQTDGFVFRVNDGYAESELAAVSITIDPRNDAPELSDATVTTHPNAAVEFTLSPMDAEGDALTVTVLASPAHGTILPAGPYALTPSAPSITVTYTPEANYAGSDSVAFSVDDGTMPPVSATVTVAIDNRAPVVADATVSAVEDVSVGILLSGTDPDSQPLTFAIVSNPAHGVLSGTAPVLTYTPAADFYGEDSFAFKVSDGVTDSNTGTITIAVASVLDPPIAAIAVTAPDSLVSTSDIVTLTATASSIEGPITRVEFYDGDVLLGQVDSGPFELAWAPSTPGVHSYWVRVYNASGGTADSPRQDVVVIAGVPYMTDFEAGEGYAETTLDGQSGWSATASVLVGPTPVFSGAGAVQMPAGDPPVEVRQAFGVPSDEPVVFVDFFIQPVAGPDASTAKIFSVNGTAVAFVLSDGDGVFRFSIDGETWEDTGYRYTVWLNSSTQQARRFLECTVRLDYARQRWDLAVDRSVLLADVPFSPAAVDRAVDVRVFGNRMLSTSFDAFSAEFANVAFDDQDRDNMNDYWEQQHGLDPNRDDRLLDADNDGLPNIHENVLGTNPLDPDSDGDGLPDGWERDHQLDPTDPNDASADPDHDGAPNWMEYQQGGDPHVPGDVTDGDQLADSWELQYFGTLTVGEDEDPDEDGLSNLQEFVRGTDPTLPDTDRDGLEDGEEEAVGRDPTDYYDGRIPQLQLVEGGYQTARADTVTARPLVVRILDEAGAVMPYAPVTFATADGSARLYTNRNSAAQSLISVRASNTGEASNADLFVFALAPARVGDVLDVSATAGTATIDFTCEAVVDDPPAPPLDFKVTENADGTITLSWYGSPGHAEGIAFRHQNPDGSWTEIANIPVGQFPAPDADGRYTLTLPNP